MLAKMKSTYMEYPRPFWVLMLGIFIDQLGGSLIFPFFALYVTSHFNVGMTEVGIMFGIMTAAGVIGGMIGGAMTDKFGRKSMLLFGLIISGLFNIVIIFIDQIEVFYIVAGFVGFLGSLSGPAGQAMIADLLPEEKRADGFGMLRVVWNLSITFGPLIGGFVADYSFNYLFIADAVTSMITAGIVIAWLPESKPELSEEKEAQSMLQTLRGYGTVFKDHTYILFLGATMLVFLLFMQMFNTLPVYMRDVQGFPNKYYGYILSMNAGMVVLFQFWFTRRFSKLKPMTAMAIGCVILGAGFGMFGFVDGIAMFVVGMIILTIGEMIVAPFIQSMAAKFSPEDMRGRYLALMGLFRRFTNIFMPFVIGVVMDTFNPKWIWYGAGILGVVGAVSYLGLQKRAIERFKESEKPVLEGTAPVVKPAV
ncbi:MAG TPA: MFS transporter [Anaerolineales bacterium]|nr:MFS transporter [Anaerolineales bacterium]